VSGQQIKCDVIEVSLAPIGTAGRDRDGHWAGDTGRMLGHESQLAVLRRHSGPRAVRLMQGTQTADRRRSEAVPTNF